MNAQTDFILTHKYGRYPMNKISFSDIAVVSCGTLSLELNHLKKEGFLNTNHLFFTTPGLHENIRELERQLIQRIIKAKEKVGKILVVYGGKFCYVNADEPMRTMRTIIEEQGPDVVRIEATHCMDMIASQAEREKIAQELAGVDNYRYRR
jgi:GTPase Era involved in 16S rRNA processing